MKRLPAIDWLRGLAVVLMVMHHANDAFVLKADRQSTLYVVMRHLGGVPAPAFMLLAGLAAALVLSRERARGIAARSRAWSGVKRGLYVLGIAFSFRLFAFVAGGNPLRNWDMIFRVDVLNGMGVSLAIVAGLCALARTPRGSAAIAAGLFLVFLLGAPFLWGHRITFPSELAGNYLTGANRLVLFPLFPWLAFTAVGFGLGEWLSAIARKVTSEAELRRAVRPLMVLGLALYVGGYLVSRLPWTPFPPHDWWKASPNFVVMRIGIQLALIGLATEIVTRLSARAQARSVLLLLGRHSLMAYLLHLEFVYGRFTGFARGRLTIPETWGVTLLLVALCTAVAWGIEWRQSRAPGPPAIGLPEGSRKAA